MLKNIFLILTLLLLLNGADSIANEPPTKKYELSVGAIFKNEAPWFKEWIEYHRLVGVEHFYLYNNGSTDHYLEVLDPYIKTGIVTLVDWPDQNRDQWGDEVFMWVKTTQQGAYNDICQVRALHETQWIALIDIDEFIVPSQAQTIPELLKNYSDAPGVAILWHLFGTSHVKSLPEDTLLIEALHRTCETDSPFHQIVNKNIVKPECYDGFSLPPHNCLFKDGQKGVQLTKNEAQINHYMNRTEEYFDTFKVKNKERMDNRKMGEEEIANWKEMGNQIEDTGKHIHRYIPELRKRMGIS